MTTTTSLPPNAVSPPITVRYRYPSSAAALSSFSIVDVLLVARTRYSMPTVVWRSAAALPGFADSAAVDTNTASVYMPRRTIRVIISSPPLRLRGRVDVNIRAKINPLSAGAKRMQVHK